MTHDHSATLANFLTHLRQAGSIANYTTCKQDSEQLASEIEAALADAAKLAKVMDAIEHHIADHQSASQTIEAILNITAP